MRSLFSDFINSLNRILLGYDALLDKKHTWEEKRVHASFSEEGKTIMESMKESRGDQNMHHLEFTTNSENHRLDRWKYKD